MSHRLESSGLRLHYGDEVLNYLAQAGFDPVYGARPLKRVIQTRLENPLASAIISGKYLPDSTIYMKVNDGVLSFD